MLVEQPIAGSDALVFPYHACKILFVQGVQGGRCAYAPERTLFGMRSCALRPCSSFPLSGPLVLLPSADCPFALHNRCSQSEPCAVEVGECI